MGWWMFTNYDNHSTMCVSKIIVPYTLNFYSTICQLYLIKTGRKKTLDPHRLLISNVSLTKIFKIYIIIIFHYIMCNKKKLNTLNETWYTSNLLNLPKPFFMLLM